MNSILLFSNRKKIIKIESWTKNYLYSPPKKKTPFFEPIHDHVLSR